MVTLFTTAGIESPLVADGIALVLDGAVIAVVGGCYAPVTLERLKEITARLAAGWQKLNELASENLMEISQ